MGTTEAGSDRALAHTQEMRRGGGEERVAGLKDSEQCHPHLIEREAGSVEIEPQTVEPAPAHSRVKIPSLEEEGHPCFGGAPHDHRLSPGLLARRHGDSAPNDGGLLRGDLLDGVAEVGLMVEVDAADDFHGGTAHGGRVEPPTHADLEHRHLDALAGEVIEGERGQRLEHGRVEAGDQGTERLDPVGEISLGNRAAVDANALADIEEVGRGVEPDPAAGGLDGCRKHGAYGALAVGAGDLDEGHGALGMAHRLEQRLDALEARTHPGHLAAPQPGDAGHGLAVGHGVGWDGPAKKARMRRSVSRSSRRSITRSI